MTTAERNNLTAGVLANIIGTPGISLGTLARNYSPKLRHGVQSVCNQLLADGYIRNNGTWDSHYYKATDDGLKYYRYLHAGEGGTFYMGNVNIGNNSVFADHAKINGSLNNLSIQIDPRSQQEVQRFSSLVLGSGNQQAIETLEGLLEELAKPQPRRNMARTLLDGIQNALPSLLTAGGIFESMQHIIAGL